MPNISRWFIFLALATHSLGQDPAGSNRNCPQDQVSFEMVTGYVYSAPEDMLDSQPGTLMLTECIETCRQNATCKSINYETGLCVLFSSNADDGGDDLAIVVTRVAFIAL